MKMTTTTTQPAHVPRIALETPGLADARVALRGVRINSRVSALCHRTTVEQTFVNHEPRAVEAVYTFPLPEQAAVCGFEVVTGDRVLTGTIEESEKAIERYDDAIAQGHAAYMAERDRPDVFTVRVGNIKPRQAATIRLTYVAQLDRVDKSIRLVYPTTVAPRYVSDKGVDPIDALVDGEALNPPHVLCVPYGLSLEVDVRLAQRVKSITSKTHDVSVWTNEDNASQRVMLVGAMTQMDRDVVIDIELAKEHGPGVQVARGRGGRESFVAVSFVPEFDVRDLEPPAPAETVFVLDCSGSMQGDSIAQATAALELCLRSLSRGDTFNVCRFGSTFEMMSSEPLAYNDATLRRALDYVSRPADLGGTELMAPLQAILRTHPSVGRVRQIILLTDGQVSNEPAIVALARQHGATNRIFTFGVGSASSAFLVKGLARATGGAAEFIAEGERIDEKVLRTFGRIASPMLNDVAIDWSGADVQTLAELPPVFDGDVLTVFGRVSGRLPESVTLRCLIRDKQQSWTVRVPPVVHDDGNVIATMWARRMIQSLEEVNDIRRSAGDGAKEMSRERKLLTDLSKEFGLLCSLTTYIAVEHRSIEERNERAPALRRVPVMLACGWGGIEHGLLMAVAPACAPYDSAATRHFLSRATIDKTMDRTIDRLMDSGATPRRKPGLLQRMAEKFGHAGDEGANLEREHPVGPHAQLHEILAMQSADGWFGWSEAINDTGFDLVPDWDAARAAVKQAVEALPPDPARPVERVTRTVTILLLLRTCFADQQPSWRRAHDKARRWLAAATGKDAGETEAWLQSWEAKLAP
jgi:Ca-activated chloride channel family protein